MSNRYFVFTENNDNEGETWNMLIPRDHGESDERVYALAAHLVAVGATRYDDEAGAFFFRADPFDGTLDSISEESAEVLMRYGEGGYFEQFMQGKPLGDVSALLSMDRSEICDALYKMRIRNYFVQ